MGGINVYTITKFDVDKLILTCSPSTITAAEFWICDYLRVQVRLRQSRQPGTVNQVGAKHSCLLTRRGIDKSTLAAEQRNSLRLDMAHLCALNPLGSNL